MAAKRRLALQQRGDNRRVGGQELQARQSFNGNPVDNLSLTRSRCAREFEYGPDIKVHTTIRVIVVQRQQWCGGHDVDTEFLVQLTRQRSPAGFAAMALTSWKLPESCQVRTRTTLVDEDPARVVANDTDDDF